MDTLLVNEIFGPTIQGEGKSSGMSVSFLRLSTCNLACSWCDTPYTWNWEGTKFVHPDKYDRKKESRLITFEEIKKDLDARGVKALVISGGEPMLQQKGLISFLKILKADGYWVEIETNGTIEPLDEFLTLIDQINCSPKLSNSGPDNRPKMRERPAALTKLSESSKTSFKFVIMDEKDLPEIMTLVEKYQMKEVYLMPEGRTKVEQLARQDNIQKICKEVNFKFSPRLHVLQWDSKRAV